MTFHDGALVEEVGMGNERRQADRVSVRFFAQQIIDDEAHRCLTSSISSGGLYLERMRAKPRRGSNVVQIEVPLPGTNDSLWARGQVVYDCVDSLLHGSAVRFTAMARGHRVLLREWLHDRHNRPADGSGSIVRAAPGIDICRPPPVWAR